MGEKFVSFLYRHLLEDCELDETEFTEDDIITAEDALVLDELNLDADAIDTYAYQYKQQCEEQGHTPDFSGYEDYE